MPRRPYAIRLKSAAAGERAERILWGSYSVVRSDAFALDSLPAAFRNCEVQSFTTRYRRRVASAPSVNCASSGRSSAETDRRSAMTVQRSKYSRGTSLLRHCETLSPDWLISLRAPLRRNRTSHRRGSSTHVPQ